MDPINELIDKLQEEEIPFDTIQDWRGTSISYPKNGTARVCSVIFFNGSYGYRSKLLEIMGLLTEAEKEIDDVVGHLTVKNVFNRIKKHYEE